MAKHGGKTTTRLGRDSIAKRLGVKLYAGQKVRPGNIIIRQKGTKFIPGQGVKRGKDDTLYAVTEGRVDFQTKRVRKFDNAQRIAKVVNVVKG